MRFCSVCCHACGVHLPPQWSWRVYATRAGYYLEEVVYLEEPVPPAALGVALVRLCTWCLARTRCTHCRRPLGLAERAREPGESRLYCAGCGRPPRGRRRILGRLLGWRGAGGWGRGAAAIILVIMGSHPRPAPPSPGRGAAPALLGPTP